MVIFCNLEFLCFKVIPCAQRDALYCLHENGCITLRVCRSPSATEEAAGKTWQHAKCQNVLFSQTACSFCHPLFSETTIKSKLAAFLCALHWAISPKTASFAYCRRSMGVLFNLCSSLSLSSHFCVHADVSVFALFSCLSLIMSSSSVILSFLKSLLVSFDDSCTEEGFTQVPACNSYLLTLLFSFLLMVTSSSELYHSFLFILLFVCFHSCLDHFNSESISPIFLSHCSFLSSLPHCQPALWWFYLPNVSLISTSYFFPFFHRPRTECTGAHVRPSLTVRCNPSHKDRPALSDGCLPCQWKQCCTDGQWWQSHAVGA